MNVAADPAGIPLAGTGRLMVLLFTDVAGSVRLKGELGVSAYGRLLARHDALFRSVVDGVPGAEVRQDTGDGFYAAFATPADAVVAALRFQLGLRAGDWDPRPLDVRVGIHLGQMEQLAPAAGDGYRKVVGLGADLAARLMGLAIPGQVLMTRPVFDDARLYVRAVPGAGPIDGGGDPPAPLWLAHGRYRLHGLDEPVDVYEAGLPGLSPLVPPPDSDKARRAVGPAEEQTLGWRPAAGREIPGRGGWHVDRKLGEGGFGEVWLGRNARTRAERVFKFCFDADKVRSLKRELTLFRLLREALGDRDDIARLHDVRLDAPPFFLESDYTPLGSLAEWAGARGGIAAVPLPTRLALVAAAAEAVAAAHSVGVLHKDLKPSNVLVYETARGDPRPRLADFGIGDLDDRHRLERLQITAAGFTEATMLTPGGSHQSGTRMYAPPELLAGRPFTVQGDVYGLGVLLYQMAVGDLARPLGVGWERDLADELLRDDVAACVDGDPGRRLGTARELADRLHRLDERRVERRLAADRRAAEARRRRRARLAAAAGLALAVLLAVTAVGLVRERGLREVAERAEARRAAALAAAHVDAGWRDQDRGDASTALLRFVEALRLEPGPGHRLRVASQLGNVPQLRDPTSDGGATAALFNGGRALRRTADGRGIEVADAVTGRAVAGPFAHPGGPVECVAFAPDGTRVVTGGRDGSVGVWDARTGAAVRPPTAGGDDGGHAGRVRQVAFNAAGSLFATASADRTARVWDARTGRPLSAPLRHHGEASQPAFVPGDDARLLTAVGATPLVWTWPLGHPLPWGLRFAGPTPARPLPHGGLVVAVACRPGGTRMLTADADGKAVLWDTSAAAAATTRTAAGIALAELSHGEGLAHAAFSADGARVVTASKDRTARVWDAETGKPVSSMRHAAGVQYAVFSSDAARVFTAEYGGDGRVWDAATGDPLTPVLPHDRAVESAAFSAGGRVLVAANLHGMARGWAVDASGGGGGGGGAAGGWLPNQGPRLAHDGAVTAASFAPGGARVVTAAADGTARLWDAATGRELARLEHGSPVTHAAVSPDVTRVVTAGVDGAVRLWDAATGRPLPVHLSRAEGAGAVAHAGPVAYAAFSPDGRRLATVGGPDKYLRLWDVTTGRRLNSKEHQKPVRHVAFSPDGRRLVTASEDRSAHVWDLDPTTPRWPRRGLPHDYFVIRAEFSPDGARVATASQDKTARVWDAATGEPVTPPLYHARAVWAATFSPDGKRVLTASEDGTARVWDAATGRPQTPPLAFPNLAPVRAAAFGPDGTRAVTAGADGSVRVWEAGTGRLLAALAGHAGPATAVAVAPDGGRAVTAGQDGAARVWPLGEPPLPDADLRRLAELLSARRLGDGLDPVDLTGGEWQDRFADLAGRHPEWFRPAAAAPATSTAR